MEKERDEVEVSYGLKFFKIGDFRFVGRYLPKGNILLLQNGEEYEDLPSLYSYLWGVVKEWQDLGDLLDYEEEH